MKFFTEAEEKVLEAARAWLTDRTPKDIHEKALAVAVAKAWPEDLGVRETCGCQGVDDCDECPTAAEMEAIVKHWEAEVAACPL